MANIMVNEACNLRCPYCFAVEFVNCDNTGEFVNFDNTGGSVNCDNAGGSVDHGLKEMTIGDFRLALDFVLGDKSERQVGIIGGEPLLYSNINEALRLALDDPRSDPVMLYTNAVFLDRLPADILESSKFRMLVNCNSPEDMGAASFEKMRKNLLAFNNDHFGEGRFRLSLNIYKPDYDYSFVIPLVQEMKFDVIRLSVSVPRGGELMGKSPLEYFHEMKPAAMSFVGDMIRCGVITGFDCNFLPGCVLTKEEYDGVLAAKEVFYSALQQKYSRTFWQRAILCELNNCTPVIDILPDLKAIRCFGLSEYTKQDIRDYRDIGELRKYYKDTVDRPACRIWSSEECESCYNRESGECSCGCLLFKAGGLFA